jgi:hypothetical protein
MASQTGYGPRHGIWILPILMGGILFLGMSVIRSLGEPTESTTSGFGGTSETGFGETSLNGLESTTTTSPEEQELLVAGEEVIAQSMAALDAGRAADPADAEPAIAELSSIQDLLGQRISDLNGVAVSGDLGAVKAELIAQAGGVSQQIDALGSALVSQDSVAIENATVAIADAIDAMDSALSTLASG